jgi:hypothetical protein
MNKTIILATFITSNKVDSFINFLTKKFKLERNKIFCYRDLDDDTNLIITFKLNVNQDQKLNLKSIYPKAIMVHKKGDTFYTINALNKLIEEKFGGEAGNIDYKSHKIDWSEYDNKFLLLKNNQLTILNIERVF